MSKDPQSEPHIRDKANDPAPGKGTDEPSKRPGQASQDPNDKGSGPIDLENWQESKTH